MFPDPVRTSLPTSAETSAPTASFASVQRRDTLPRGLGIVTIAVLPWMLLSISTHWIYTNLGYIDPWLYHGFFHRFPEFVSRLYPDTYYGTRLAWILPGYVAYQLFPPHAANLVLHLGFYYVALLALYRAGTLLGSAPAALVASVAFGTSAPVLAALGMDYIDGALITYMLVGVWAIVEAATHRRRTLLLITAGAAAACVVHCNLAAVVVEPTFVIAYWLTPRNKRWTDALWFAGGALLITAAMGVANVLAGGPFLFFMSSVRWAKASLGQQLYVPVPPLQWPGSSRFVVPLAGIAAAAGAFLSRRTPATRVALFMLLYLCAAFVTYDWIYTGAMLQTQYYVSWFLPLAFLGLAVALAQVPLTSTVAMCVCAVLLAVQGSILANAAVNVRMAIFARVGERLGTVEITIAAVAVLMVLFVSARARRAWHAMLLTTAGAIACFVAAPNLSYGAGPEGPHQFEGVQQTLRFIHDHVPGDKRVLFWIQSGPLGQYYSSIASTHLYAYSLVGTEYPKLPKDRATAGRTGAIAGAQEYVVVLSDQAVDPAVVSREFGRFDLGARIVSSQTMHVDQIRYVLTLVQTSEL